MNTKKQLLDLSMILTLALLLTACDIDGPRVDIGQLQRESQSVPMADVDSLKVNIEMAAGELFVAGGATDLIQADFAYNVAALKPIVESSTSRLSVLTPDTSVGFGSFYDLDDYRNEWDLKFSDDVSMEMEIEMGAGSAELDLGSLSLSRLDIETGAGNIDINLADSTLEILRVQAGAGRLRVDMSGDWMQDLDAEIEAGIGEITIILPKNVGVRIDVDGGITDINAEGFSRRSGYFTNDAFGQSDVTLEIRIQAGIGEVNLVIGD